MKFGVREICDVVLKAKAAQRVGNKIFYKGEPVVYFDTLKTSSMEGAATTVYAQGGRGNSRLVAWEGERTITFTMEDALISPAGFMILSGAGLVEASATKPIKVHHTEQTDKTQASEDGKTLTISLSELPFESEKENLIYVMRLDSRGEVYSEPYIAKVKRDADKKPILVDADGFAWSGEEDTPGKHYQIEIASATGYDVHPEAGAAVEYDKFVNNEVVLVDFYVEAKTNAFQVEITPDKFGGNYYLEASTLFRTPEGVDLAAEFIIPNCKVQSNFTFTMASSGDPSSFTFTMDAFPDYTRFDPTKKVLAAIQVVDHLGAEDVQNRKSTAHKPADVHYI
jgi:hypothetical protein